MHLELGELEGRGAGGWQAHRGFRHAGKGPRARGARGAPQTRSRSPAALRGPRSERSEAGAGSSRPGAPPDRRVYIRSADYDGRSPRRAPAADRRRTFARTPLVQVLVYVLERALTGTIEVDSPGRALGVDPGARRAPVQGADERAGRVPGERPPRARVHRRHDPERLARVDGEGAAAPRADPPRDREDHRGAARSTAFALSSSARSSTSSTGRAETRFAYYDGFDALHTYGADDTSQLDPAADRLGCHPHAAPVGARARGADARRGERAEARARPRSSSASSSARRSGPRPTCSACSRCACTTSSGRSSSARRRRSSSRTACSSRSRSSSSRRRSADAAAASPGYSSRRCRAGAPPSRSAAIDELAIAARPARRGESPPSPAAPAAAHGDAGSVARVATRPVAAAPVARALRRGSSRIAAPRARAAKGGDPRARTSRSRARTTSRCSASRSDATPEQVQQAFLALAKTWHPDRLPAADRRRAGRLRDDLRAHERSAADADRSEAARRVHAPPQGRRRDARRAGAGASGARGRDELPEGRVLPARSDIKEAEVLCRKAHEADPTPAEYLAMLAWLEALKPENQGPEADERPHRDARRRPSLRTRGSSARTSTAGMLYKRLEQPARARRGTSARRPS